MVALDPTAAALGFGVGYWSVLFFTPVQGQIYVTLTVSICCGVALAIIAGLLVGWSSC
jgi:hypothetical protein